VQGERHCKRSRKAEAGGAKAVRREDEVDSREDPIRARVARQNVDVDSLRGAMAVGGVETSVRVMGRPVREVVESDDVASQVGRSEVRKQAVDPRGEVVRRAGSEG